MLLRMQNIQYSSLDEEERCHSKRRHSSKGDAERRHSMLPQERRHSSKGDAEAAKPLLSEGNNDLPTVSHTLIYSLCY